ncbi:putative phosphatidylinositol-4-phosphate 5-Kinase [Lyophyllum shimeji]|uniref:Phosphatidylinositol-4-phosphate 5-Kinase n=1 Tax=Lyophyllum shimeji TaxID=47721 RepID=A0A9P3PWQ5_LYOSH|nr:putative phosphatidylinositol-4-phosphate 5-Kinase [Lyophyllum shimeji]
MADVKPLPALPPLAELSIDARQHRARLIRHFLSEIREHGIEYRREPWADALEVALDELGQCLSKDRWLDGVRRWRVQQWQTRKRVQEMIEREMRQQTASKPKKLTKPQEDGDSAKQGDSAENSVESSKELPPMPSAAPKPEGKHLLLCVAPLDRTRRIEEGDYDAVSGNVVCTFMPGTYAFQDATVLFGDKEASLARSVGGTFALKGVDTPELHGQLVRVLRLATYVHLALMLEQHLFTDSSIKLTFPRPKLAATAAAAQPARPVSSETMGEMAKKHTTSSHSFLPPGIFSFFSRTSMMRHRASTAMPRLGRDQGTSQAPVAAPATTYTPTRTSQEFSSGLPSSFHFPILGKKAAVESQTSAKTPFTQTVEQLEANAGLLSTSVGVRIDPPQLIVALAERETAAGLRLKADERTALTMVLGWEGKSNLARGMTGTVGFVRQQGIEVLQSHHVPHLAGGVGTVVDSDGETLVVCGRPVWRRYRYYAQEEEEDVSLGTALMDFAETAEKPCEVSKGRHTLASHETRLVHGNVRVIVNVERKQEHDEEVEEGTIEIWESCATCKARSARRRMSDGTYLLSFGKFLELLIYSPVFGVPSPAHCPHTERFDVLRHFATPTHIVSFACTRLEDIFELRVPPLQIMRGEGSPRDGTSGQPTDGQNAEQKAGEQERRVLRSEMRAWWAGVADYMDKLEEVFTGNGTDESRKSKTKALPRIPSTDDQDEDGKTEESARTVHHASQSTTNPRDRERPPPSSAPPGATSPQLFVPPETQEEPQPLQRLDSLRQTFHRKEQSLYSQLSRSTRSGLNDVRRSFTSAAKGSEKRLDAWQKKNLNGDEGLKWKAPEEPEWWKSGSHACPGSDVIIREDDLGSIIAFTLSSPDYQRELANMSAPRSITTSPQTPQVNPPLLETPSDLARQTYFPLQNSDPYPQLPPDGDSEDGSWDAPENFSAVISRKDHPRDATSSLLSIREVLRREQKSPAPDSPRFNSIGKGPAPSTASAWGAKPEVQLSKQEADGIVSSDSGDGPGRAAEKLQELDSMSATDASRPSSRMTDGPATGAAERERDKGRPASVSDASVKSDATVGKESAKDVREGLLSASAAREQENPPPPPPKDGQHMPRQQERSRDASNETTTSSLASTFTTGLGNAMRYMLHPVAGGGGGDRGGRDAGGVGGDGRAGSPQPAGGAQRPTSLPMPKGQYGLLSLEAAAIDERPHVKYDWTIGKRLKFSCTVYYAKQFDLLRRKCQVDEIYGRSLRRSANWAAEGGKSRSNFWKTADDRFIIKTLVDAWNVADLQVLIDLGPSYFRYLDTTEHRPTVLTKMLGFYTIEIRNLETGIVQSKTDLLVMENLFYTQKASKTFDLKGIQGRRVRPANGFKVAQNPKTLYDGEWIEGQQKSLMLVRPHSKHVLQTAVNNDAEFLAKSNIMDYSLLVGVNEEDKVIVCGLVDTIGSYTFARTLEYKAKQGLTAGRDVTVIPPAEYQERFVNALEGYFLPCPDKWTKPLSPTKIVSDVNHLPSVL